MAFSPMLEQLIDALRCLPGVGLKTAQRMTLSLLTRNRENGRQLAHALLDAMDNIQNCQSCRIFSETELCAICRSPHRDQHLLCIVEDPSGVIMIEQTGSFKGRYFVLLGRLSPLDGMGPEEIGMAQLKKQFETDLIREIILATNPTVEGDATAHYIAELAKPYHIKVTRIAHGVPIGSELAYTDMGTITLALQKREVI